MARLPTQVNCPACATRMVPRVLACPACGVRIEAEFRQNEFAGLEDEWLHFLRIFVHCEGRIRDMEAALGISYPTVKARMAELKQRLDVDADDAPPDDPGDHDNSTGDGDIGNRKVGDDKFVDETLDLLESGEIDYDEAVRRLREGD
jgi:hypothetical protein